MGKASPLLSIISRRSALKLFGAAAMTAFGTAALAGCRANTPTSHSPVRLLVKVPRTGHDVVFDDSINEVSQVITAMGEAFEAASAQPVKVEVEVFEQNQYDNAIVGSFDTDRAVDLLYGD